VDCSIAAVRKRSTMSRINCSIWPKILDDDKKKTTQHNETNIIIIVVVVVV
jgi:hypothetical protein